ncbi:hypothetical protein D9757_014328 [Collybiopsis confluens]|uniref:BTB domain-containing protein n=1 Tax=Collybiopsis confluens TaxID=2823264 RepID=A0A8H5CJG2_9AGAR|nr:hypothetical protein D9757_014328 [Collybiopsis confluens]
MSFIGLVLDDLNGFPANLCKTGWKGDYLASPEITQHEETVSSESESYYAVGTQSPSRSIEVACSAATQMDDSKAAAPAISLSDIDEITLSTGRPVKMSSGFYFDCVIFQVEYILYSLPRNRLIEESSVFEDMFTLPQGSGKMTEGSDNDNPIHLEQTKRKDWECLLKLLFHRKQPGHPEPEFTLDEWVSVLTLAARWEMNGIRNSAIDNIARLSNPAKKVSIARNYHVSRLILPSLVVLVGRSEPLSATEAADLGIECAMKLVSIRERCHDTSQGYNSFRQRKIALDTTPNSGAWNAIVTEIHNVFIDHEEYYK